MMNSAIPAEFLRAQSFWQAWSIGPHFRKHWFAAVHSGVAAQAPPPAPAPPMPPGPPVPPVPPVTPVPPTPPMPPMPPMPPAAPSPPELLDDVVFVVLVVPVSSPHPPSEKGSPTIAPPKT